VKALMLKKKLAFRKSGNVIKVKLPRIDNYEVIVAEIAKMFMSHEKVR